MTGDSGRAEWLRRARSYLRDADPVLARLPDDELIAELTAVPGIGPWTAQGALILALGREDVVLPGDLALRKAVRAAYQLDHLPAEQEVLAIADHWRPSAAWPPVTCSPPPTNQPGHHRLPGMRAPEHERRRRTSRPDPHSASGRLGRLLAETT